MIQLNPDVLISDTNFFLLFKNNSISSKLLFLLRWQPPPSHLLPSKKHIIMFFRVIMAPKHDYGGEKSQGTCLDHPTGTPEISKNRLFLLFLYLVNFFPVIVEMFFIS